MSIENLLEGYHRFYHSYFEGSNHLYKKLSDEGQTPDCLVISCSDSRVDPTIIFNAQPGDLFVIRNVANLIPPFHVDHGTLHGVSAALEFAVQQLAIRHIIILGHSQCAGIQALYKGMDNKSDFIEDWVNIAESARSFVKANASDLPIEEQLHLCEKEAIKLSLKNLESYPWVQKKIVENILSVHGWHFHIHNGTIESYMREEDRFVSL